MINVLTLRPGDRLHLQGNFVVEVTENMEDGMWVMVRYLEAPGKPDVVGMVELCHAQEILSVAPRPSGDPPERKE